MAAAYAALVSLFNNLELIQAHPHHSFSFENKQIRSLLETVTFLIEFLERFDSSHGANKEAAQLLNMQITSATHAAEEVIESHVVDHIHSGSSLDGGRRRRSRFLLDLQKVIQDMDYVKRKSIKLKQAMYSAAAISKTSTLLISQKSIMVGFDDLLYQLLDLLTGEPRSRRVVSIVGTGGIGKTTLARNAFEHPLIVQRFDVCLWASISQNYVAEKILLQLLSRNDKSSNEPICELGEQLHKRLFGRRYLIVLDDMWSVEAWEEMKFFFPDTDNGSRVVVTSRNSHVADHIGSSCIAISFLDEDKSWALFCEKTFGGQGCPSVLEGVGRRIVEKCKGLPLAIVVVAGHLRNSTPVQEHWENVANNMISVFTSQENKQFLDILSFSYTHLPVHLKPCFIYMGTYREDEFIHVSELIRRWIAEGFLKPCKNKTLEEIAKDQLKDLIDRNLVFPISRLDTRHWQGEIEHVGIHDILRELCIKVAEKEMFFYMVDSPRAICRARCGRRSSPPLARSLTWEEGHQPLVLKYLRVLKKIEASFDEDDRGMLVSDLQHVNLRCIDYYKDFLAYKNYFLHLPSPLSMLWNLQSLVIRLGSRSFIAPYEIWEMTQLRNLEVHSSIHLPLPLPLPSDNQDRVMENLQTLSKAHNLKMSEEVCRKIPNIKELELIYSDIVEESSYYSLHNLGCFHKLESLRCRFGLSDKTHKLGSSLALPSSIKNLSLTGSRLCWEELTMKVGSLPHLETLKLFVESVVGSEWTLVDGKFPRLKYLSVNYCEDLSLWNVESSHFPVLERLDLVGLFRLDELPSSFGEIPTLGCIFLVYCGEALMISAARVVAAREEEQGDDDLRLELDFFSGRETVEKFNKKLEEEGLRISNLRQSYKEKDEEDRMMGVRFCMRDF